MKKKITTEHELLFHVATQGDAAAFYSLISPFLREYFMKLRSHGDTLEESTEKIFENSISLFRKLQHSRPDNFESWLESELESMSHHTNSDNEIVLDKNLFQQCETVLANVQRQLLRTASVMKNAHRRQGPIEFFKYHKIACSLTATALVITVLSLILFGYYGMRIDLSFSGNGAFFQRINSAQDTISTASSADTVKQTDSTVSVPVPETPVQEPKPLPPPPKPRPRVTYTPPSSPAPESEISESNQISRPVSDQVPQSTISRSEKLNQTSGYSSQSQTSENQPISSYNTSGSTSSTTQQSSQQQTHFTQEQNQP